MMGHLREATADYGTRVICGKGGLNSRLSLSAELTIELFCLAHIVCHGDAGEKCLVPPVGRNSVSTSKI